MTRSEKSGTALTLELTLPARGLPAFVPGSVWMVGAGPGDPALCTLLGIWGLGQADVIFHDALIQPDIFAFAGEGAELVNVGKRAGTPSIKQEEISKKLIAAARAGKRVFRLKGGDPFVFARGGEEAEALAEAKVPFRIVPGVTSGVAALSYAGIPSTHRDLNQSVTFISAHDRSGGLNQKLDWGAHARCAEVLVIYMGSRILAEVAAKLLEGGRSADEPLALISRATWPDQRTEISTLGAAADAPNLKGLPAPALIVCGEVVDLRAKLDWFAALGAPKDSRAP